MSQPQTNKSVGVQEQISTVSVESVHMVVVTASDMWIGKRVGYQEGYVLRTCFSMSGIEAFVKHGNVWITKSTLKKEEIMKMHDA